MINTHISIDAKIDPGTDISTAFTESITLASKLGCVIRFDFNGVTCLAYPYGDYKKGTTEYRELILDRDVKYKFASS